MMRAMSQRLLLLLMLSPACERGPVFLDPGFEADIVKGWACEVGPDSYRYVALPRDNTYRLQARRATGDGPVVFPSDEDWFHVYTGLRLVPDKSADKCDDVLSLRAKPWGAQRIDYTYEAISGEVAWIVESGEMWLEITDVVLRAKGEDLDDINLSATLPAIQVDGSMHPVQP